MLYYKNKSIAKIVLCLPQRVRQKFGCIATTTSRLTADGTGPLAALGEVRSGSYALKPPLFWSQVAFCFCKYRSWQKNRLFIISTSQYCVYVGVHLQREWNNYHLEILSQGVCISRLPPRGLIKSLPLVTLMQLHLVCQLRFSPFL